MIITTNITMDLSRRGPTQVISAVQDDRYSRNIAMALTCGGVAWEPPEGTTVQIRYRTAGGTGGNYDALPDGTPAWTIDGNILTIALAPQVCTVPGKTALTVALLQEDVQLHTFAVTIDVQPNPGLQPMSGNYYKVAGSLPDSGWEPGMLLGTDTEGNVVAVPGSADLPSGDTDQQMATDVKVVRSDDTITVTVTYADGAESVSVIDLDENEYPVSITTDGTACAVSWEGFDV